MKETCNIIGDMLPLVAEGLASEDTVNFVKEHLKTCTTCRKEYEELKRENIAYKRDDTSEAIPLKDIKRKLKNKNIYIGLLTGLIVSFLFILGFHKITKPIPLSYGNAIESTEIKDGNLFIKFKPGVSNYSIESSSYDDIEHGIMAWKTNFSNILKGYESKTTVIKIDGEEPVSVRFISQEDQLDTWMYGKKEAGYGITLPRLAMNYYFFLMGGIFLISGVLSLVFRKMHKIKILSNIIMIFSFSYMLGHLAIYGLRGGITHHMIRDLSFIVILAVLLFSIFSLLLYREKFLKFKGRNSK